MADLDATSESKKISQLPVVTSASGDSWLVINVDGITSRIRKADLLR